MNRLEIFGASHRIDQLNGKIDFEWHADGLVCRIAFDMAP